MPKYIQIFVTVLVSILIVGCSTLEFPGAYKINIEQGNVITQDMVDQLKPCMSMEQVEYVMGTPLIKDSFNGDRWDYVYNIKRGDQPRKQHRISIFFEYESLKYFTGDFIPSNVSNQADSDAVVPEQES